MGMFGKDEPETATVRGKPFRCLACSNETFWQQRAQLHGGVASLFDIEWLVSPTCDLLVCSACGYVHWFLEQ
jgi:predicted nucleic-acid-binding Zn-ribbon protein